ncbi:MAG: ester cyclase [Anaerolineae bacterium]|nr:ester cyclase [Anaerolineae bacterium]
MRRLLLILALCALIVPLTFPTLAQESDPVETANRANIYTFAEYVKNRNRTELIPLINSDSYIGHTPFVPEGGHSTMDEMIQGEVDLNQALDLDYTHYLVLAEGDYTALIGYQEADFTAELFGTPPTGEHWGGQIFFISEYEDGLCVRDIELWNQVAFMQFMGWAPADYTFDMQPWSVRVGSTSTSPAQHHQTMQVLWDALGSGSTASLADAYAPDVVTHDYLATVDGVEPTVAMYANLAALPGFTVERSEVVCEGDLCATAAVTSITAADSADEDGKTYILWAAVHRFVDGKIAEEWWLYDNAALWPVLPPNA